MAEVAQGAIDDVVSHILESWRAIGFEIDGTRVKTCPKAFQSTASGMKEIERLLQPEYEVSKREVEPKYLALTAIPPSAKGLINTYISFVPEDYANYSLGDYKITANFNLRASEFPSDVIEILELSGRTGSSDDETRSKYYGGYSISSMGFDKNEILGGFAKNLKNDLRVALALKEYDERHPTKS